jgi:Flp pilus assembly protein TadB
MRRSNAGHAEPPAVATQRGAKEKDCEAMIAQEVCQPVSQKQRIQTDYQDVGHSRMTRSMEQSLSLSEFKILAVLRAKGGSS